MAKAYDRVHWPFLLKVLHHMGFSEKWVDLIKRSINSSWFCILINGSASGFFQSSRGLRQGDPISPGLFVLAADYLSRLLDNLIIGDRKLKYGTGRNRMGISHLSYADDILIFTQANEEAQSKLIRCLNHYEKVSGQKINAAKSNFYIHEKHVAWVSSIRNIGGFSRGTFPFTYLGVPLYRGKKKNDLFWFIKDRIANRVLSWSHKLLSFGGRLTLIKSTLASLPLHVFQVLEPTAAALQRIEQILARFFWGSSNDSRKTHWIKWLDCCRPCSEGGLGIRRFHDMVQAFSYKLWWRFREQHSLWAQYLYAKYCSKSSPCEVSLSRRFSPIWRRMFLAGQKIHSFMRWSLGEGKISFWDDIWLNETPLREMGVGVPLRNNLLVRDLWRGDQLDVEKIKTCLEQGNCPVSLLDEILAIPFNRQGKDVCRWSLTGNGNFSSASAWQLARTHQPAESIYDHFWNTALTPSMSIFLWRLVANRIPVDSKLQWRNIQMASKCRCYKAPNSESAEHLFIHSEAAKALWSFYGKWFNGSNRTEDGVAHIITRLRKWWTEFPGASHMHISSIIPCLIMWFLWLERNDCTFQGGCFSTDHIRWRINLHLERLMRGGCLNAEHWKGVSVQHPLLIGRRLKQRITRATRINWIAPENNWIKVNTDGAFSPSRNRAGGGGLIRNSERRLISALCSSLQAESSLEAELKALDLGIATAAECGQNIWVEMDAAGIVQMFVNGEHGPADMRHIVGGIRNRLRSLNVKFSYIAREGNKPADLLAAMGVEEQGLVFFDCTTIPARIRALDEKGLPNFQFQSRWT